MTWKKKLEDLERKIGDGLEAIETLIAVANVEVD